MPLAVPTPATFVPGVTVPAAFLNTNLRDAINFLINPPLCTAYQTAVQSIPNATFTSLACNANEYDSYSGHSTVTNNSRYVAQVTGFYLSTAVYAPDVSGVGERRCRWSKNGTIIGASESLGPASTVGSAVCSAANRTIYLVAGDYLEVQVWQNTGGAQNTFVSGSAVSYFSVCWAHA